MSLFKYRAVAIAGPERGSISKGELVGETSAEVRARLRAGGMQVVEIASVRRLALPKLSVARVFERLVDAHLRSRRHAVKEEICDALATLLDAGVPLVEAIDTSLRGEASRHARLRRMLVDLRDQVRAGASFAAILRTHPSWFDPVEVALLDAAEHGGTLSGALRSLASRQAKRTQVGQKIASALIYPGVVATVGVGVWIFLSTTTLPELAKILTDANVEVPGLTRAVMSAGGFVAHRGAWVLLALLLLAVVVSSIAARVSQRSRPSRRRSWVGFAALRRLQLARVTTGLAELLQGGVPLVDGLRAVSPIAGSRELRNSIDHSAMTVEQGKAWSETLENERWFPPEFRRLVETGENSGELASLLGRLGERMERSAQRRIERLASLLEPAAILALAVLIGLVVAAAVLPITSLQELV